jgi:hypothetical protein
MTERFIATNGTISIGTGDSTVVGVGTLFAGHDRAGSLLIACPAGAAPVIVGAVAEVVPQGVYDNLSLPLVAAYHGAPIAGSAYMLIDGLALANGASQAAIFARFAALLAQSMGLVGNTADTVDMSLVPNNTLFVDNTNQLLKQWRGGVLSAVSLIPGDLGRTAQGDADKTFVAADGPSYVTSAALTAARTWTLPSAASVGAGARRWIIDEAGAVSPTNPLTVARAGTNTIEGGTSLKLATPDGAVCIESDGVSKWTKVAVTTFDQVSQRMGAETTIASATTTDVGASPTTRILVSVGGSPVTSLGTVANKFRILRFAGAITITHNAATLACPGAADILTIANGLALAASDGAGNWRILSYVPPSTATGRALLGAADAATARLAVEAAPFDAAAFNGLQLNGSMEVSQEKGTTLWTPSSSNYVADGITLNFMGSMVLQAQQVSDAPPGYQKSLKITVTTAEASLAVGSYAFVEAPIEGYRVARLAFGGASAQPVSLGFWLKMHRAGTYPLALRNTSGRGYPTTFTVNAADTWEFKTFTIAGDQSGTWLTTNGVGLRVSIGLACGVNNQAGGNAWNAFGNIAPTGALTNGVAATSDTFQITGVIVLPGIELPSSSRAPLIMRPYDQELALCKRYFYNGVPPARGNIGASGQVSRAASRHPTTMRAAPSLVLVSALPVFDGAATSTVTSIAANYSTVDVLEFDGAGSAGLTANRIGAVYQGGGGNLNVDARL